MPYRRPLTVVGIPLVLSLLAGGCQTAQQVPTARSRVADGRGDLPGLADELGRDEGLAGDAGVGVLAQVGVEDGVGNLIGNLVGMSFSNGFGGKQVTGFASQNNSFVCVHRLEFCAEKDRVL